MPYRNTKERLSAQTHISGDMMLQSHHQPWVCVPKRQKEYLEMHKFEPQEQISLRTQVPASLLQIIWLFRGQKKLLRAAIKKDLISDWCFLLRYPVLPSFESGSLTPRPKPKYLCLYCVSWYKPNTGAYTSHQGTENLCMDIVYPLYILFLVRRYTEPSLEVYPHF